MTHLARTLLAVAVHLLPSQCRSRYDDEFDAELLSLSRRRRLGYALSILAAAPRLRWALLEVLCGGRASLRCWLGKHHDRRLHPNPDNHEVIGSVAVVTAVFSTRLAGRWPCRPRCCASHDC